MKQNYHYIEYPATHHKDSATDSIQVKRQAKPQPSTEFVYPEERGHDAELEAQETGEGCAESPSEKLGQILDAIFLRPKGQGGGFRTASVAARTCAFAWLVRPAIFGHATERVMAKRLGITKSTFAEHVTNMRKSLEVIAGWHTAPAMRADMNTVTQAANTVAIPSDMSVAARERYTPGKESLC
jgi:hypothetical protein